MFEKNKNLYGGNEMKKEEPKFDINKFIKMSWEDRKKIFHNTLTSDERTAMEDELYRLYAKTFNHRLPIFMGKGKAWNSAAEALKRGTPVTDEDIRAEIKYIPGACD